MSLLDVLAGSWHGSGEGHYPTIDPFGYAEHLTFTRLPGKPILHYLQRTTHAETDEPLHTECGYVRIDGPAVELLVVQPTGFTEVHHAHEAADGVSSSG